MHRSHLLRWFALSVAVLSVQCLQSLSDDCTKTRTCEPAPQLRADCRWYYPDGGVWAEGPTQVGGLWVWPDGQKTDTQSMVCPPSGVTADAGLGPIGVGPCPGAGQGSCDPGTICDETIQRCVRCQESSQCKDVSDSRGALPACDARIRDCVVCLEDTDCASNGNGSHCKRDEADPRNNRCVECTNTPQCTGAGEFCDTDIDKCTTVCSGKPGECKGLKAICNDPPNGRCVQCLENTQCSGATPQCNTARKECVPCVDNSVCGAQVCSPANRCVDCVDDSTCAQGTHCDPASNKCVACVNDSQCTAPEASRCNAQHQCAPCNEDSQCESTRPLCDLTKGACVECVDNSTCGNGACDVPNGKCVGCVDSTDCNHDATLARCDTAAHLCAPCSSTSQCLGKFAGNKNICRNASSAGECVECTGNGDCAGDPARSKCNLSPGVCTACAGDGDCSAVNGKHACLTNGGPRCVECTNATHCAGNANGLACNTTTNTCVECVADTDCHGAGASRCVNSQCVACVNDAGGSHCDHVVNGPTALKVCDTSGGAGVCVQCTGTSHAACGTKACISQQKVCSPFDVGSATTCQDCVSDDHCAAGNRCVQETFPPPPATGGTNLGFSCFNVKPTGSCPGVPYAQQASLTSIDGVAVDVCMLRRTTCAGINQFGSQACTADADCGEAGLNDGVCDTNLNRCSVPCSSVVDCPTELSTCSSDSVCLL